VLLYVLEVMCVVGCFRWQCVLLYVLCGKRELLGLLRCKVSVGSFRLQCVLLGLSGGSVCFTFLLAK